MEQQKWTHKDTEDRNRVAVEDIALIEAYI